MVYNSLFLIIIAFNFFILKTFQQDTSEPNNNHSCNYINECFSCIATGICNWDSNSCIRGEHSQVHLMFSPNQPCNDLNSIATKNMFCGPEIITFQNNKVEITLPNVLNVYGKKDLFCSFELNLESKSSTIIGEIQIEKKYFMDMILQVQVTFSNGSEERFIDSTLMSVKIKRGKTIRFYYYQIREFDTIPFKIVLHKEKNKISISMILTIILIILLMILSAAGMFLFKKRIARRKILQAIIIQQRLEEINPQQIQQNEEQIQQEKEQRLLLIKSFITNNFNPIKFNSDLATISSNCTICLDEYNSQSDVVKTECGHVFHFKCIENWLYTNIMNVKCPNCNYYFLEDDRLQNKLKEENQQANIIQNRNEQHNEHNENNVVNIQFVDERNSHEQRNDVNQTNQSRIDNSNNNLLGNNYGGNNDNNNDYIGRLNKNISENNNQHINSNNNNSTQVNNNNNVIENNVAIEPMPFSNDNINQVKVNKNLQVLHNYENANNENQK